MGLLKKIFKPVSKVLDKIIPNEIKPALPYLASFAPFFGPTSGLMGQGMLKRALISGGLNIGAQLAQEGNEGEVNLLSAGLGALSGAMTAPGAADTFAGATTKGTLADQGIIGSQARMELANRPLLTQAKDFGLESLAKGSKFIEEGLASNKLMDKAAVYALPTATATGDVMEASARQLEKQNAIDEALAQAELVADSGLRGEAIRNAMLAYGFFTDDEIDSTIASAGYRAGGRVGFRFGGIDEAIESVQEETIEKGKEGIMTAAKEDPLLVEEYNKYVFDLMEQRPNAKPMSFQDFKRMIMSGMKDGGLMKAKRGLVNEPGGYAGKTLFGDIAEIDIGESIKDSGKSLINMFSPSEIMRILSEAGEGFKEIYFNLKSDSERENLLKKIMGDSYEEKAKGGRVGAEEGGLMNLGGREMDLRGGGFVPIGKKERADDVPARLSKNEFVMTADAVRAAGGGSVNEGAKRMYKVMNDLEARA